MPLLMPYKAKHRCNYRGCQVLTSERFCAEHAEQQAREDDKQRKTANERGYTATWAKVREMKLNRDPLCERCTMHGMVRRAVLVHHRDRNPLNNQEDNHESLCANCHDIEHRKERFGNHA